MQGRHHVEEVRVNNLHARLEQFGSNNQREQTADQQHGEREPQVQGTYIFMVSRKQPTLDARRVFFVMCVM